MTAQKTMLIPYMGNYSKVIQWALNGFGVDAKELEPTSENSIERALEVLNGSECLPCLITLGDLLKALDDVCDYTNLAFFMPTSEGPCRFGLYRGVQRLAVEKLGINGLEFLGPDTTSGYSFGKKGKGIELLLWKGVVCIDIFEIISLSLRPYLSSDANKSLGAHYNKVLEGLSRSLKSRGRGLKKILIEANRGYERLLDRSSRTKKPKVGLVGEIFLRGNNFANGEIVVLLERLGLEVRTTPMVEWLYWVIHTYAERLKKEGKLVPYASAKIKLSFLRYIEHKMQRYFPRFLHLFDKKHVKKIALNAFSYADECFGGEGVLMLGKAIEFIKDGINGVVCIYPFGCMPGNVVRVLSVRISKDFCRVPWLNVGIDYQENTHRKTRLEAFAGQVKLRNESR